MAISNIRADFHAELQRVWDIVTSLEDTAWRSDLSKMEVIDEKQFVEHTTSGYGKRQHAWSLDRDFFQQGRRNNDRFHGRCYSKKI